MEGRRKSEIDILMDSLKGPVREAMRRDPDLMHRAYSLEARIAMAEVLNRKDELQALLSEYSTLSTEARKVIGRDDD